MKSGKILLFLVIVALIFTLSLTLVGCNTTKLITFQSNGGTPVDEQRIMGSHITEPEAPTREGYEFKGWSYRGTLWDFENMSATENMTLVATWKAKDYNVIFQNCEGVELPLKKTFTVEDSAYVLPTAPVKEGYVFLGWYSDEELTQAVTSIDTSVCQDVTVYAKWEQDGQVYTIEYYYWDNPDGTAPTEYRIGDTVTLPLPEQAHSDFIGWHLGGMNGELVTELDTSVGQNVKLYAEWRTRNYTITYENCEGASHTLPDSYNIYSENISLTAPTLPHYTFLGWFSDPELTAPITEIVAAEGGNRTVYASFEVAPHTFLPEWSYDENSHWHPSDCGHPDQRGEEADHTLSGRVCTVCGYDDGLCFIEALLGILSPTAAEVNTSLDTGLADEPMTGEYVFVFNGDGSLEVTYVYDVFSSSDSWADPNAPVYEQVSGNASVDAEGNVTGTLTARIIRTGTLSFNLDRESIKAYKTEGSTVRVTVEKDNAMAVLGYTVGSDVTVTFTTEGGEISEVEISFTEDMGGTAVPVIINSSYEY